MKLAFLLTLLALTLCACDKKQEHPQSTASVPDSKLGSYFERYCNETGNLGIGFVAWHTYDFEFRQRLKRTQDVELKRLLVLKNLYRECDGAISAFEEGIIVTGQSSERQMTTAERSSTRASIIERLDDLSRFDPGDPQREIAEFKQRINRVPK